MNGHLEGLRLVEYYNNNILAEYAVIGNHLNNNGAGCR